MKHKQYPKRDAIKNYFPMPNEIFALGLGSGGISVYSYLLFRENRKTYQCYPGYRTIGRAVGMSQNTVRKYVMELEAKQLITTEPTTVRTKAGYVRNGTLLYTIRPIQDAVEYFHAQQLERLEMESTRRHAEEQMNPPA